MRRALFSLLGATATTAALIGGKFVAASSSADQKVAEPPVPHHSTSGGGPSPSDSRSPSTSASPSASAKPSSPSPSVSKTASPITTSPSGGGSKSPTRQPSESSSPTPSPTPDCEMYFGDNALIWETEDRGLVFVNITVCDGVLTEASAGTMMTDWEPMTTEALNGLNKLAVKYYKTDISMITYSGATETSAAYRASLQSALSQAGI